MNRTEAVSLAVRVVKQSGTTQHVLRRGDKYDVGASDRKGWKVAEMIGMGNVKNFEEPLDDRLARINRETVTSWTPTVNKTRFKELGYWHIPSSPGEGPSFWQCVDLTGDRPAQVGTQYATEKELLANLESYATEYGCDNAMPKSPVRAIDRHYDGQAHHMAKAANSLVIMLTGIDYSTYETADAVRLTASIHSLINHLTVSPTAPVCDCHPMVCGTNPDCAKHGLSAIAEGKRIKTYPAFNAAGKEISVTIPENESMGVIDFDNKTITFPDRSRDDAGAADPRNDRED